MRLHTRQTRASAHFHARTESERYAENTRPVLVRNATIWTAANNGYEVLTGDLLMHRGLIKAIGDVPFSLLEGFQSESMSLEVIEADGAWVTPGIVDLHSHIGVGSVPELDGKLDMLLVYPQVPMCCRRPRYQLLQGPNLALAAQYRRVEYP